MPLPKEVNIYVEGSDDPVFELSKIELAKSDLLRKLVSSSVCFATVHNTPLFIYFHLSVFLFCDLRVMYFIFGALVFSVLVSSLFCVPPARWQVLCFTVGALVETSPEGVLPHTTPPLPSPLITLRDRNQQRGETESTLRMSPPHNDFDATCWKQMIKSPSTKSRRVHVREFYYVCFSWNFVVVKSQRRNLKKCKIMVTKKREGTECRNCCGNLSPGSFPSHIPLLTVSFYITSVTHRDKYRHRHRNIHTHRCSP